MKHRFKLVIYLYMEAEKGRPYWDVRRIKFNGGEVEEAWKIVNSCIPERKTRARIYLGEEYKSGERRIHTPLFQTILYDVADDIWVAETEAEEVSERDAEKAVIHLINQGFQIEVKK